MRYHDCFISKVVDVGRTPGIEVFETNSSFQHPPTTIYWSGNVRTDANGEASISFYTADNATNYTITVTGLTANGELIYKRMIVANSGKTGEVLTN